MVNFVDKSGKKRRGIEVACQNCEVVFVTRADQPQQYCSRSCRDIGRQMQVKLTCSNCGKCFDRTKSKLKNSKSKIYFCSRKCKDQSQKIGGIQSIMPSHYGISKTGRNPAYYRRLYKREFQVESLQCCRCGYSEFECGIDIHHKDGDCSNNSKENLISLCSPCHRALHSSLWHLDTKT